MWLCWTVSTSRSTRMMPWLNTASLGKIQYEVGMFELSDVLKLPEALSQP
jgi:hypothetical protein